MSSYRRMSPDTAAGILRVAAGARWTDVLAYLDGFGQPANVQGHQRRIHGFARGEYGKTLRWTLEKQMEPLLTPKILSRNRILSADAEVVANHSASSVDALQEYFIPAERLSDFIREMRTILPNHPNANLMNVSIHSVAEDKDVFLRYATGNMFSLVLSIRVGTGAAGDDALAGVARELTDKALELGGTFYLPYRQHATPEQLLRAYPKAALIFNLKRKYDPGEVFQNKFYAAYGNHWVALQ